MSTATAPTPAAPNAPFKPGLVPRAIAAFSGTPGQVLKITFLALSNSVAIWAAYVLADQSRWISLTILVAVTAAIDLVYLAPHRRTLPLKFLVPGTIFLLAFQIVPIVYTIEVALSNYSTGHIISKADAIQQIKINSLQQPENGKQYEAAPARDKDGHLVLILRDDTSGAVFVGTQDALKPLAKSSVKVDPDTSIPIAAAGYTLIKGAELFSLDKQLSAFDSPDDRRRRDEGAGRPQRCRAPSDAPVRRRARPLRADQRRRRLQRQRQGLVRRREQHEGRARAGLEGVHGLSNFHKLTSNPLYRDPFVRVFIWTLVYATLTVFLSFAIGLFLAITLDKKGLRFQRLYRSVLVIPYAMPGFLSLLVWGGLLNDEFGVVNKLFHTHIPWLFDANWARVSVILVSVWLTTPYFFLVSMGALQSIPAELTEAARVDGGGGWAIFKRVTLPLLLVAVAPLMIASFAFNFNNFNNIFLLTGGGPYSGSSSVAGSTDILISYTYKLAIQTGKGSDYGLASTVGIVIFFIVASISGVSFWRSKSLENVN